MDYGFIILVIVVLVVLTALALLKKLSNVLLTVIGLCLICSLTAIYIMLFPSSSLGVAFTEHITPIISLDSENKYCQGEVIYTTTLECQPDTDLSEDITDNIGPTLLTRHIKAYVSAELNKTAVNSGVLYFKDSYLLLSCEDSSITLSVVKGTLNAND